MREREERIAKALARLPELTEIKRRQGKKAEKARASSTDAEATVMKMGDGGFRPASNAQYATDGESQVIVGTEVVTAGSDQGQLVPMIGQVAKRCGNARRACAHCVVSATAKTDYFTGSGRSSRTRSTRSAHIA